MKVIPRNLKEWFKQRTSDERFGYGKSNKKKRT